MLNLEILKREEIWTDEIKRTGHWVVGNIETSISWPVTVQKLYYDGITFWIIPITRDAFPGIAARIERHSREEIQKRILRLLSVISWVVDRGAILHSFSGGSLPHSMGRSKEGGFMIRESFDFSYLPVIEFDQQKLALALMREGRGLNHPAFSFLSFFRAIEVAVGDGKSRKAWMPTAISNLTDRRAKEALAELQSKGIPDVARHLYDSGRCAIAHANANPIIDPDDPEDSKRLYQELPIIENLAQIAVEEMGVKTATTIYRGHLYELAGFGKAFGPETVNALKRGDVIPPETSVDLPVISIRLRGRPPFSSLENLVPHQLNQVGSRVLLVYGKDDGTLQIKFHLNFPEERLDFDIHDGVFGTPDDGSARHAEMAADLTEFQKWYFMNGCLEIVDAESGEEISRKDAFMPLNVIVQPEGFDREIDNWKSVARDRRSEG